MRYRLAGGKVERDPDGIERTIRIRPSQVDDDVLRWIADQEGTLDLDRVIGKGGQGTVRAGRQRALRRAVAVKHTDEYSPDDDRVALVHEAWLTGALEHPNIVPIHDLQVVDGEPHVVMKHLDGVPWSDLIGREDVVQARFGLDLFTWNLRTLVTVCHAVGFAHSRGILHLDLKPANVMVGDFGEVWVVDWGIATRVEDAVVEEVFGTPAYMAPEMTQPGARVSVATDVYLLGALLHHIVLGRAPRTGRSAAEVLARVLQPTAIPDDAPMVGLLRQTLALDPDQRPASAADVRRAVERFLEHQGAFELARRASEQLVELTRRIGEDAPRVEVYNLFGACRFGFEESLRSHPDNPLAVEGRREALALMVRYELDAGDDRAAELLLDVVEEPPDALLARFQAVRDSRRSARARLARIREDEDVGTGWQARAAIALAVSGVFVATPVGTSLLGIPQGYLREVGIAGSTFVLVLALFVVLHRWLVRSRISRVLVAGAALGPSLVVLMHVGCWLAGMDSELAGTLELFVYFVIATVATVLVEVRLAPSALGYLVAYYLAMAWSGSTLLWMNLANLLLFCNVFVVWVPAGFRRDVEAEVPLV
jgi:serine/threonine-protein kinase